jgi:predicted AlkP superfamily phosphohydrolase/phosphomutase
VIPLLPAAALLLAPLLPADPTAPSVFVLGIDGMDPVILRRLMDAGQMPSFSALAAAGTLQPLGTINPPQSPVAWSSFVTGRDPGGHGVFDFIHRDPHTYAPLSSSTLPPADDSPAYIKLGGFYIPLGGDEPQNTRGGLPFWDLLHAAGVPVQVYRMPGNFPVTPSDALTLSGMGTVDLRGEFGKFTWYVGDAFDHADLKARRLKADLVKVEVEDTDADGTADTADTFLRGPPDFLRLPPGQLPGPDQYLTVPVRFALDPEDEAVWITAGSSECVLKEGEWSEWLPVSFDAAPMGLMPLSGIVRFYARSLRPKLEIYASPVNIDPAAPASPIATPDGAAEELAQAIGPFWTQGFPEEINALKDGLFSDDDYVRQVGLVHAEAEVMLDEALRRFGPGQCTFFYLSDIDLQCHMLWRHGDPKTPGAPAHPGFDPEVSPRHAHHVEDFYRNADRLLGKVHAALPPGALLMAISDHGFQAQTRQFHLNAWLRDEGYLVLKQGTTARSISPAVKDGSHEPDFDSPDTQVDWGRTRAYGLGFNGLYLNLQGREARGCVAPADADALMAEIAAKLEAWRDPQGGRPAVRKVHRTRDIYHGERVAEAPDMVVGYDAGYGCSDASTLGAVTEAVIEDNAHGFTGNHLMDPDVVPGILLVNRRLSASGHDLLDVTATLLSRFGVPMADGMTGTPFLTD